MDKKEIEQKVKEILADRLDIDINKIKPDSDLVNDLGMDSFIAVELLYELKEQFGVEIPQDEFSRVKLVKDILKFIDEAKKRGA